MGNPSIATASDDLERLAQNALTTISRMIDFDHASLILLRNNKLVPLASVGIDVPDTFPNVLSVCSWVCDQKESVLIDDVSQDMRYHMIDPATQSELAVPLLTDEDIVGVLNLESNALAHFYTDDLRVAESFAAMLAWSLRALLDKQAAASPLQVPQRLRQAEMLTKIALQSGTSIQVEAFFDDITEQVQSFFQVKIVAIWLFDHTTNELALRTATGHGTDLPGLDTVSIEDPGIVASVYRSHTLYASNDLTENIVLQGKAAQTSAVADLGLTRLIATPLSSSHVVYGVLMIASSDNQVFSEHDTAFVQTISQQIGTVLANVDLYKQEQKRANFLHVINQISSEVSTLLDFDELAQRIVSSIQETLGYEIVQLMLREGDKLIVRGSINADGETPEMGHAFALHQRIAGRAVRTARSYVVRNVDSDPDYVAVDNLPNVRSQLAVPIGSKLDVLGALVIYSSQVSFFDSIDREAIESLASQASIAIENARLYQESQRRLQEQSIVYQIGQDVNSISDIRNLTETLVYQVANALSADGALVLLNDLDGEGLAVRASYGLDDMSETALRALKTYITDTQSASMHMRQPILIAPESTSKYAQASDALLALFKQNFMLIVPLSTGAAQPVGYIVWVDSGVEPFATSSIRLAETLANQSAIAIERARLQEETRRQLQRETILRRVAEASSTWTEQEAMLNAVVEETTRALRSGRCNIYLLEGGNLKLLHGHITSSRYAPIDHSEVLYLDEMPALHDALNEGGMTALSRSSEGISEAEMRHFNKQGYGSLLMASMISQNTLLGAIEVLDERVNREFSPADRSLLDAISSEISVAIDNSRLYEGEQRRRALLEKIQTSGQTIASELQVATLLQVIVEQIVSVFEVDAADIMTQDRQTRVYDVRASLNLAEALATDRNITADAMREILPVGAPSIITAAKDTQLVLPALLEAEGVKTVFSIPLLRGDVLFGALNMYSKTERQFSESEQDLAEILARQIAISLDNASLFEMLEERARQLAEVNRLKNEFLANVSHELRTPMNSIIGFTDTILMGVYGPLNETQEDRLNKVKSNALNLLTLIDDLLDLSKIEAGQMSFQIEEANIASELHEICSTFEPQIAEKELELIKDFEPDLSPVYVDRQRLRQVMINLISNAVKFTNDGTITITAKSDEYKQQSVVHFAVADTGIGISLENQKVIFDQFRQADGSSTRQYEGTGLGLAICRKLVAMMDGDIWVESKEGAGSSFHVVIPTNREME